MFHVKHFSAKRYISGTFRSPAALFGEQEPDCGLALFHAELREEAKG
jgi:hypothetical protein